MKPAPQLHIRPMNVDDLDAVIELAAQLPEAPHWPRSSWLAALNPSNAPHRILLIAEQPAHPIAFAVATLLPPEAELESIAVAQPHQRSGIASSLLQVLAAQLRAASANQLLLEVRASNRAALGFYGAHGFHETGRRSRYYADPQEDAILMALPLEASPIASHL